MIEVGCHYSTEPVLKHAAVVWELMETVGHGLNGDCRPVDHTCGSSLG